MSVIHRAGELSYISFGRRKLWFYLEWGDGVMVFLGPLRGRVTARVWWNRNVKPTSTTEPAARATPKEAS